MRSARCLSLSAVVLVAAVASIAPIAGCGSDDTGQPPGDDSGPVDAGHDATTPKNDGSSPAPDTGAGDGAKADAGGDTGAPDAGDDDGGADGDDDDGGADAGADAGDAGADSGDADAGVDSGAPDAGTDSGAPDTGTDAGDTDTGADGGETDGAADGPTIGFTNPVQIDVGAILNANTVVTTTSGGLILSPMDGTANSGANNDFPTQAKAAALDPAGVGLPDDAVFASDGVSIPNVKLAWTNTANGKNSLLVAGNAGTTHTFAVPSAKYSQVQIYVTGGNGGSTLNVTLTYASGTPGVASVPVPDWCVPGILAAGEHKLVSVDRVQAGNLFNGGLLCNIYAVDLDPDSSRVLTQVSFVDSGVSTNYLVFYGATAW